MAELWLAACSDQRRQLGHPECEKGREKFLQGVWYRFFGDSSKPKGLRDGRGVLQLHPALDLLHTGPVREGVQMEELRPAMHRVLLLGEV